MTAFAYSRRPISTMIVSLKSFARKAHGYCASRLDIRELWRLAHCPRICERRDVSLSGAFIPSEGRSRPSCGCDQNNRARLNARRAGPARRDPFGRGASAGKKRASALVSRSCESPFSSSRDGHGRTPWDRNAQRPCRRPVEAMGKLRCARAHSPELVWVMAPMTLIDYVIAHEACHVLEHNHSRRFWRSLETIMPDYENRVLQLDRLGHSFVSLVAVRDSLSPLCMIMSFIIL